MSFMTPVQMSKRRPEKDIDKEEDEAPVIIHLPKGSKAKKPSKVAKLQSSSSSSSEASSSAAAAAIAPERRYPGREHRTPQEGLQALEVRLQADRDKRVARTAEQQRLADLAREERLALPPVKHEGRTSLDEYAINIHRAYNWGGRESQATTAVGLLGNRVTGWPLPSGSSAGHERHA